MPFPSFSLSPFTLLNTTVKGLLNLVFPASILGSPYILKSMKRHWAKHVKCNNSIEEYKDVICLIFLHSFKNMLSVLLTSGGGSAEIDIAIYVCSYGDVLPSQSTVIVLSNWSMGLF